jgi:hypothetical protein
MFGPNYIWDTKGWPKFVGTINRNRKVWKYLYGLSPVNLVADGDCYVLCD